MTQLIGHPGTNPSLILPVVRGSCPDVDGIWRHLAEPADFFGVPMPDARELSAAVFEHVEMAVARPGSGVLAVTVTLFEVGGRTRVEVRSEPSAPSRASVVRIAGLDGPVAWPAPGDPHWRRMAARTTSRGHADQLERWLTGRGYVDAVPSTGGAPFLGALVFDAPSGPCGIDRSEPVSILDQLTGTGLVVGVARVADRPTDATLAWWISPRFETYPVASIEGTRYRAAVVPPFLEQP